MDQEIGQPAFDRFEVAEARIGGVQPCDQRDDAVLEMAGRDIVAARLLDLLDLVGQQLHQRFQLRRHRGAALRAFGHGIGERRDAVFEIVERVAGAARRAELVDLVAERLHLGGQPADRVVGCDMRRHVAQGGDGVFELSERLRIALRDDQIDLVRQPCDGFVEADQIFRRRQAAQGVAHFGEPVLDAGQGVAVDAGNVAGLAAFGDALREALNLLFDGVDRLARHRLAERAADVAEFVAQRVDGVLDAGAAQRLDLVGDLAKMVFQARQVLARHRHQHRRGR